MYSISSKLKMPYYLDASDWIYLVRYSAVLIVYDICNCSYINILAPPGIVSVRLLLTTHSSTSLTTFCQIWQELCKSVNNYTTCNGFKHTTAMILLIWPSGSKIIMEIITCLYCLRKTCVTTNYSDQNSLTVF